MPSNPETANLMPHSWIDEDGRKHTTFLVWSEHLRQWCVSAAWNGSVGSPSLIPMPDVAPVSPMDRESETAEIDPDEVLIFFRAGIFYPVSAVKGIDLRTQAQNHAALNRGTLRVEDKRGNVLWRLQ